VYTQEIYKCCGFAYNSLESSSFLQRTSFPDFVQNFVSFENSLNSVQTQAQKPMAFVYSKTNNKKIAEC